LDIVQDTLGLIHTETNSFLAVSSPGGCPLHNLT